jgi:hypothetical protein
LLLAGPPFCTGYAYNALRRSRGKSLAAAGGLILAGLEVLLLAGLIVYAVLANS